MFTAFPGVRGTGNWVADQRPKNWREAILFLYPNGSAPLTALLALMASKSLDDPEYTWWTERMDAPIGAIAAGGVHTDAIDGAADYVSGGAAGDTLYFTTTQADAKALRVGHEVLLRDASNPTVDCVAKVTAVSNASSPYGFAGKLLEADDNGVGNDLSDADTFMIIGNINEEGGTMPFAIASDPSKMSNYAQIFRTPLSITRTAQKTKLRTNPQEYAKLKRQALERHSVEMEGAFWFGVKTETTGADGKPERTTHGLIPFIRDNAASNILNWTTSGNGSKLFETPEGNKWLLNSLEQIFSYGSGERVAFCGPGAITGLNILAQTIGDVNLQPGASFFGMDLWKWVTPYGTVHLKLHPLWRKDAVFRNTMVLIEPQNLQYRFIDDTTFYDDPNGNNAGDRRRDAKNEEFLTEAGLEMDHPQTCGILHGVGLVGVS